MKRLKCVAMLLAGGQGSRLGPLTKKLAKPAVPFGGKYRIIDFALSNCTNSHIETVGVLTQYQPHLLNAYVGNGRAWDLDRNIGGVSVLPPYKGFKGGEWYKGTANAIYQNIRFLDEYNPEWVLVLSGDHIYKMDYNRMIDQHAKTGAFATIGVIPVAWEEAGRFGIMNTDADGKITAFEEKPKHPKNNLASMGTYVFNWERLRNYLIEDERNPDSSNDFGKDIIPQMLQEKEDMYAYEFSGYWKDVGTVSSLWEANMDLLEEEPALDLNDPNWKIYTVHANQPPHFVSAGAKIERSLVNEGCIICGNVTHSVVSYNVKVGKGSEIKDSVIMPDVRIGENVRIHRSIVQSHTVIEDGEVIGSPDPSVPVALVGGTHEQWSREHDFIY
ncbi:MAG TPA: glucose-1-phosphate adenylyltransferase [Bacillales bacterium]|nr:glucose-1-phosphate adenylyltransferase [Bacillales bacterium]